MADSDDDSDSRFDDVDLESILARVERRGPLTFTRKRCLYRAPEFVRRLALEDTVDEGATVKFDCKVFAFPKASVKWYKDNEEISDISNVKTESLENGEYAITITDIKKSDEGAYRCKVENPEGSSTCTIYVAVKAKNKSPKKKNPACAVTFPSPFPPITENIEAEEREEKEVATQAESPLTHLYNGVKWKNRTWPDFLGGWECVNGFHFNDFEDTEDEEDVFLPEESINNEKNGNLTDIQKIENGLDSFNSNDVEINIANHVTIPNLIFENKNLLKTDMNNCEDQGHFLITPRTETDENGNLGLQETNTPSAFHSTTNMADQEKIHFKGSESVMGNNITTTEQMSSVNYKLDKNARNNVTKDDLKHCCKNQETNQEDRFFGNIFGMDFLFLISGFTLIALSVDLAPDMFIFSVFIGQLLYCMIRFLLKEV